MISANFTSGNLEFVNYTDCSDKLLLEILHQRNSPEISKWMRNTSPITESDHYKFIEMLKTSNERIYFAVMIDGRYVGSIYMVKNDNGNWERGLYVMSEHQGKGIATLMERCFISHIEKSGIDVIEAEVFKDNPNSLNFHKKMGYQIISETKDTFLFTLDTSTYSVES